MSNARKGLWLFSSGLETSFTMKAPSYPIFPQTDYYR